MFSEIKYIKNDQFIYSYIKIMKEWRLYQRGLKVAIMTTFLAENSMKIRVASTSTLTWIYWQNKRRDCKFTKERIFQFTTLDGKKKKATQVEKEIGHYKNQTISISKNKEW